jgi:DNA-binding GntR family transcriptional regulator
MNARGTKEKAYQYLYNQIITYQLKPGDPIVERDVSLAIETSRTPVREALNQLEADGLVTYINGRGCFVSNMNLQDVADIYYMRKILEAGALHLSWPKISKSDLNDLEKRLEALDENSSEEEYLACDHALHNMIINYSGNQQIIKTMRVLDIQTERMRRVAAFNPERQKQSKKEHLELVRKMKERDFDGTVNLLQKHIDNVKANIDMVILRNFALYQGVSSQ